MYKILLVDDEILVRDAIRENIDWKSLDCELVGDCENGRQAVEFVQSHKVDVVLTDICMPYMDGMELSEFLHDNYPDILIVIFSGFGEFEYAKKAIRYNVSEYMLKPVTAMELTKVLRNMKEKLDSRKKEQKKMESLSQTSKDYHKNVDVIRSKALETLVNCTRDVQVSLLELKKLTVFGQFYHFFGLVFSNHYFIENPTRTRRDYKRILQLKQVLEFIEKNYANPITLQELSASVSMSPKYFCRFFSEMTHQTPVDYLNRQRIEEACLQLAATDDSITEIAYRNGFNDLSYFIRTFKKYKGMTPGKYKRR